MLFGIESAEVGVIVGVIVGTISIVSGIAAYHRWYAKRAIHESKVADVVEWFKPRPDDPHHKTLPEMVKQMADNQEVWKDTIDVLRTGQDELRFGQQTILKQQEDIYQRLDQHLDTEEREITRIWQAMEKERNT